MLKDDLFVRSPKGMHPTPRAEEIALPLRHALDGLQHSLEPMLFDPSQAKRTFQIALYNYNTQRSSSWRQWPAALPTRRRTSRWNFAQCGTLDVLDLLDRGQLDSAIKPRGLASRRR
jgi:DNA-binding transcriptional LysR family regulator